MNRLESVLLVVIERRVIQIYLDQELQKDRTDAWSANVTRGPWTYTRRLEHQCPSRPVDICSTHGAPVRIQNDRDKATYTHMCIYIYVYINNSTNNNK